MDISFKTKEHPDVVTVQYDVPETLQGLIEAFGEETVVTNARGAIVIGLQAFGRRHIDKPQEEIQGLFNAYRPDTRQPAVKKSALEKATSAVAGMSNEERLALLQKLQAQLAAA